MKTPRRIQRQRTRGWRMPVGAVYVGRPSRWGNPFMIGNEYPVHDESGVCLGDMVVESAGMAVDAYRDWVETHCNNSDFEELRGRNLACWCALNQPCHADVLLELANAPEGAP